MHPRGCGASNTENKPIKQLGLKSRTTLTAINAVREDVGINPVKSPLFALTEVKGGASTVPPSDGNIIDT